ncbi:hypothetical protein GSH19_00620 [Lactobacillus sp. S2-2]|uniref:hypothetical protein n=1 Tax=Lactobacillus sp. S2-2 TaxID=2692917 RepID=UPI001F3DA8F7|nr:hypothetical protein [Lactobacillus sp. S2-2]MCF6514690.1 hypothetical protein [Lactobacillus sp. S2-2]
MPEKFTDKLINDKGASLADEVYQNQFIQNIKKGIIEPQYLIDYVNQDNKYLDLFVEIHAKLLNEVENEGLKNLFQNIIDSKERIQHERLCELAEVKLDNILNDEMLSGTKKYMNNMQQALETNNQLMIISAILPCHWIYYQFATRLMNEGMKKDNPYYDWVVFYADSEESIDLIFNYLNQIADSYSKEDQIKAQNYFNENCAYENQFFQQVLDKKEDK